MAEDNFQEKTEKATPRKRQKAREKGQAAKSVEITSVIVLLTGSVAMYIFGHYFYSNLLGIMRSSFTFNTVLDFDLSYCISFIGKVTIKLIRHIRCWDYTICRSVLWELQLILRLVMIIRSG